MIQLQFGSKILKFVVFTLKIIIAEGKNIDWFKLLYKYYGKKKNLSTHCNFIWIAINKYKLFDSVLLRCKVFKLLLLAYVFVIFVCNNVRINYIENVYHMFVMWCKYYRYWGCAFVHNF